MARGVSHSRMSQIDESRAIWPNPPQAVSRILYIHVKRSQQYSPMVRFNTKHRTVNLPGGHAWSAPSPSPHSLRDISRVVRLRFRALVP
jgi:hypothetical protein